MTSCVRVWMAAALLGLLAAGAALQAQEAPQATTAPTESIQQQLAKQQRRIAELERLMRQQGELLRALQARLAAQNGPNPPASDSGPAETAAQTPTTTQEVERLSGEMDALAENAQGLNEKVKALEEKTSATEKSLAAKVKGLGNFSFGGDLRLRYEPFRGGTGADRNRGRFRVRLDIKNKFSDEWSAGVRLATGDLDEPISTNQSFTGFFVRKSFAIDRAFIVYTPNWFEPLTLTGGKFGYTWKRTELTFDSDLNPEGISPVLSFDLKEAPLKNIKIIGVVLPFRESSGGKDSYAVGGGLQAAWNLGTRAKLETTATYTNWFNTDSIRQAVLGQALLGNSNTNAASDSAFASRFGLLDLIAELKIDTGAERWPLVLLFDYVTNTRACANVSIAGVACNPDDRQGYWAEIAFGQAQEQHDFEFGYTLIHIEQEAVLSPFNFSDLRQATDVVNHRFSVAYQLYKNITLGYTLLVGRQLGSDGPWLKRSQIDTIYKF